MEIPTNGVKFKSAPEEALFRRGLAVAPANTIYAAWNAPGGSISHAHMNPNKRIG